MLDDDDPWEHEFLYNFISRKIDKTFLQKQLKNPAENSLNPRDSIELKTFKNSSVEHEMIGGGK